MVMSLLVRALLRVILFFLKVVMMLEEVMLVASLSLFPSPPTPTTRPCGACLAQNISKARAGDPDRLSRGERTHWGGNLPVAQRLFLLARHLEGARTITLCHSDRGCLFPFTRYRPPRDGRHVLFFSLSLTHWLSCMCHICSTQTSRRSRRKTLSPPGSSQTPSPSRCHFRLI